MNAFHEHQNDNIRFADRCFDRILLNGLIQPFQQPERGVGFFGTCRDQYPVSRDVLRDIAQQFQHGVTNRSPHWGAPILDAPDGERDKFVAPYFRHAKPDQIVAILKAREPARLLIAIGKKAETRGHHDSAWGRMFVRVCPYFPFSARLCLNQHHWLAPKMRAEGLAFRPCPNAFLSCSDPTRLHTLADSLTARDLEACGQKWLTAFTPFFTPSERQPGCQHRLFFAQVEYCDNLIFRRRAALDRLGARLFDANRTIGQPAKLAMIFGRKVTQRYRGQLQTVIEDLNRPNPVIRTHYGHGFAKQYVRDRVLLRTEPATNNVTDYGVKKAVEHLPALREKMGCVIDTYLTVQQDILETFVDRDQLRALAKPTILPSGKRIPGLKLDHPRQLALMHALVCFAHIPAQQTFTTADLYPKTLAALGSQRPNTRCPRCVMISRNYAPRASSTNSRTPDATASSRAGTRSRWSFSSSSNESTRP
jgi:hypothetical protein